MNVAEVVADASGGPDTWQTVAAIATTVAVVVAIAGLIAEWRRSRKSQELTRIGLDQDREIAEATASRAEAAAALSEDYTRRVVEALEAMATRGIPGAASAPAPAPAVRWSLVHHSGDTYRLTNEGTLEARDIEVGSHESLWLSHVKGGPNLSAGEALTFMAAPSLATSDMTITVSWLDDASSGRRTWRYPLPGRPPR